MSAARERLGTSLAGRRATDAGRDRDWSRRGDDHGRDGAPGRFYWDLVNRVDRPPLACPFCRTGDATAFRAVDSLAGGAQYHWTCDWCTPPPARHSRHPDLATWDDDHWELPDGVARAAARSPLAQVIEWLSHLPVRCNAPRAHRGEIAPPPAVHIVQLADAKGRVRWDQPFLALCTHCARGGNYVTGELALALDGSWWTPHSPAGKRAASEAKFRPR